MTTTDSTGRATVSNPQPWAKRGPAWRDAGLVFVVALLCYFPFPLDTPLAATEGHRAMTAHQMVESGEWLVPRLYGRVYLAKPPLHYWILAASETVFGTTRPWVWRLPAAVEGAMLAAILCAFGRRWFGRIGGLVSGLSYVALFTLWGENRGADIDVTNTLAATLACLCLIELHLGRRSTDLHPAPGSERPTPGAEHSDAPGLFARKGPGASLRSAPGVSREDAALYFVRGGGTSRHRALWVLTAALAVGASLMVKGPASLTIIMGTYVWLGIVGVRRAGWRWLARPSYWLPLVFGVGVLLAYGFAAVAYCKSHGLARDLSGVQEGIQDLHRHNIKAKEVFEWLGLPATMFVFSLPVSLSLVFASKREVRGEEPVRARLMAGLAMSVLLGWGICFLSGMHLPRYAFVTLPLLCPLAGAVASRVPEARAELGDWLRVILRCTVVGFCIAAVYLAVKTRKSAAGDVWKMIEWVAVAAGVVAGVILLGLRGRAGWRAAWGVGPLLILLSVLFAAMSYYDRVGRTSIPQARLIRAVAGEHAHLVTCQMVLDQPDLFYYSGLPTRATDGDWLDWREVPLGTWVVLEPPELERWKKDVPGKMKNLTEFTANRNKGILLWYGDAPPER